MADIKKEQEREELHRAIWAIADELRGSVDGWDFKNYVLGTMFYRYISENLTSYINEGDCAAGQRNLTIIVFMLTRYTTSTRAPAGALNGQALPSARRQGRAQGTCCG